MPIISLTTARVWGIIVAFALLSLAACTGLSGEPKVVATIPPVPTQVASIDPLAQGETIFRLRCASCHGIGGRGDGELVTSGQLQAVPDLTDLSRRADQTLDDYFEVITYGRIEKLMPPWEGALSEDERWAVARYAYALAGETTSDTPPQSESQDGVIEGFIENGTADAAIPDTLTITLYTVNMAGEEITTQTIEAVGGIFRFDLTDIQTNLAYVVSTDYGGVTYISDMALGSDFADTTLTLPITIYETTSDSSGISISLFLQQAAISDPQIGVDYLSILRFTNTSDRAYLPETRLPDGRPHVLTIPVPQGGTPLMLDTRRYLWDEATETLIDTLPVLPGDTHIVHIPFILPPQKRLDIRYRLDYALTSPVELMLPPGQFALDSTQFSAQGTMQFSTGVFEDYLTETLGQGDTLQFSLIPITTPSPIPSPSGIGVLLVSTGVILLVIAAFLIIRQRRATPMTQAELVAQIAQLDLAYQNQQLSEKRYHAQRERLKRELARLLKEIA